ncbi:MAG TPA: DUF507 family protein [Deferrisomatales bacterium]|nr:DUF507 family protein [Deferrisomatales bacterium]
MRPSDEKLRAVIHAAAQAVESSHQVRVQDSQGVRDALRRAVAEVMELHREIHDAALQKVASLSRNVRPGTREHEQLVRQYADEALRRRSL